MGEFTNKFDVVDDIRRILENCGEVGRGMAERFNWLLKVWNTDDDRSFEDFDPTKPYGDDYRPD